MGWDPPRELPPLPGESPMYTPEANGDTNAPNQQPSTQQSNTGAVNFNQANATTVSGNTTNAAHTTSAAVAWSNSGAGGTASNEVGGSSSNPATMNDGVRSSAATNAPVSIQNMDRDRGGDGERDRGAERGIDRTLQGLVSSSGASGGATGTHEARGISNAPPTDNQPSYISSLGRSNDRSNDHSRSNSQPGYISSLNPTARMSDIDYRTQPELLRPGRLETGGPPADNVRLGAGSGGFIAGSGTTNPTVILGGIERGDVWDDSGSGANPLPLDLGVQGETGNISDVEREVFSGEGMNPRRESREFGINRQNSGTNSTTGSGAQTSNRRARDDSYSTYYSGLSRYAANTSAMSNAQSAAVSSTAAASGSSIPPTSGSSAVPGNGVILSNASLQNTEMTVHIGSTPPNTKGDRRPGSPASYRNGGGYVREYIGGSSGSSSAPQPSSLTQPSNFRMRSNIDGPTYQSVRELIDESSSARRAFQDVKNRLGTDDYHPNSAPSGASGDGSGGPAPAGSSGGGPMASGGGSGGPVPHGSNSGYSGAAQMNHSGDGGGFTGCNDYGASYDSVGVGTGIGNSYTAANSNDSSSTNAGAQTRPSPRGNNSGTAGGSNNKISLRNQALSSPKFGNSRHDSSLVSADGFSFAADGNTCTANPIGEGFANSAGNVGNPGDNVVSNSGNGRQQQTGSSDGGGGPTVITAGPTITRGGGTLSARSVELPSQSRFCPAGDTFGRVESVGITREDGGNGISNADNRSRSPSAMQSLIYPPPHGNSYRDEPAIKLFPNPDEDTSSFPHEKIAAMKEKLGRGDGKASRDVSNEPKRNNAMEENFGANYSGTTSLSPRVNVPKHIRQEPNPGFFESSNWMADGEMKIGVPRYSRPRSSSSGDPRSLRTRNNPGHNKYGLASSLPNGLSGDATPKPFNDDLTFCDHVDESGLDDSSIHHVKSLLDRRTRKNDPCLETTGKPTSRDAVLKTEMERLKANHRREIVSMQKQISRLENALRKSESKHAESQNSAVNSRKQSTKWEKEAQVQRASIERLKGQLRDSHQQTLSARSTIRKLEDKVFRMGQNSENIRKIDQLTSDLNTTRENLHEREAEVIKLQERVDTTKKENDILTRSLIYKAEELGTECKLLYDYGTAKEDAEALKMQLHKFISDMAEVERQNSQFKNEIEQLHKRLNETVEEKEEIRVKYDRQEDLFINYEEKMRHLSQQKIELEERFHATLDENTNIRTMLEERKNAERVLQQQVDEHGILRSKAELETERRAQLHLDRVHELTKYSELIQQQLDQERRDASDIRTKYKESETRIMEYEKQMAFMKKKYDAIDKIQGEIDEEQREKKEQTKVMSDNLSTLKQEYKKLSMLYETTVGENETLRTSSNAKNEQFRQQEKNIRSLICEKNALQEQMGKLVERLRNMSHGRFEYENLIDKQSRQIERLKRNRTYLEETLASQFRVGAPTTGSVVSKDKTVENSVMKNVIEDGGMASVGSMGYGTLGNGSMLQSGVGRQNLTTRAKISDPKPLPGNSNTDITTNSSALNSVNRKMAAGERSMGSTRSSPVDDNGDPLAGNSTLGGRSLTPRERVAAEMQNSSFSAFGGIPARGFGGRPEGASNLSDLVETNLTQAMSRENSAGRSLSASRSVNARPRNHANRLYPLKPSGSPRGRSPRGSPVAGRRQSPEERRIDLVRWENERLTRQAKKAVDGKRSLLTF